jgi:hypothetical protein
VKTAIAAGQVRPFEADKIEHLAESKRDHDKVDAFFSDAQEGNDIRDEQVEGHADDEGQKKRGDQTDEYDAGRVSTDAEEDCVAERKKARVSENNIVPQCEDGKYKHLRREGARRREEGQDDKEDRCATEE